MAPETKYPEYDDYQLYQRLAYNNSNNAPDEGVRKSQDELGGFVFDAFADASSSDQYMQAPGSLRRGRVEPSQAVDIASNDYFQVSPNVDTRDAVTMHFLVHSTISRAKGFRVMSYDELETTQDEITALRAHLVEIEQKLAMERKIKEATLSMAKLGKYGGSGNSGENGHAPSSSTASAGRRSFLFNKDNKERKRLSKQVEDEAEEASRRIERLEREIPQVRDNIDKLEAQMLQHHVAVLAVTHQSSESSSSMALAKKKKDETQNDQLLESALGEIEQMTGLSQKNEGREHASLSTRLDAIAFELKATLSKIQDNERQKKLLADGVFKILTDVLDKMDAQRAKQHKFGDVKELADVTKVRTQVMKIVDDHMKTFDDLKQGFQRAIDSASVDKYREEKNLLEEQLAEVTRSFEELQTEHDSIRNEHFAAKSDWQNMANEHETLKQKHTDLSKQHDQLKESHEALSETFQILQQSIDDKGDSKKSELANNALKNFQTRGHLNDELDALRISYEANRTELERLEIENVDLRSSLQESEFRNKAEVTQLENELSANNERIQEWKERCEMLKLELESVVKSLEDVTRQAVDYESERVKLEQTVQKLQNQIFKESNSSLDKRVSMLGANNENIVLRGGGVGSQSGASEPLSVSLLRHEFRKIIRETSDRHHKELKSLREEKRKLERLLRSVKTSSYMATLTPETLSSLSAIEAVS